MYNPQARKYSVALARKQRPELVIVLLFICSLFQAFSGNDINKDIHFQSVIFKKKFS